MTVQIYQDDVLVYDSDYPSGAVPESNISGNYQDFESYHLIEFSDRTAYVFLTGYYDYQFSNYVIIAGILLSVILFFSIVMSEVRKILGYICRLNEEIQILESGNLEYEITESGSDELSCLAKGLNSMRKSLREQMNQKEQLVQANSKIITELSHEIRTPLTSRMIYTEILRSNKAADCKLALHYIDKIADRARRIQNLADHIIQYFSGDTSEYPLWEDDFSHGNDDGQNV